MKTLLLMRHAKSDWDDNSLSDHDRPLNPRGQYAAPRMGQLLRDQNILPDLILSSTANRASSTARQVIEAAGCKADLLLDPSLYLASPKQYIRAASGVPDTVQRLMLVGHNPGLEITVQSLTGCNESMPTAALAVIEIPILHWADLCLKTECKLLDFFRPKELD